LTAAVAVSGGVEASRAHEFYIGGGAETEEEQEHAMVLNSGLTRLAVGLKKIVNSGLNEVIAGYSG